MFDKAQNKKTMKIKPNNDIPVKMIFSIFPAGPL